MDNTTAFCKAFLADETGVTAIELGLLAALLTLVIVAAISEFGTAINNIWVTWTDAVDGVD